MPVSRLSSVLSLRTCSSTSTRPLASCARTHSAQHNRLAQVHSRTMSSTRPEKKQRTEDYVLYYVRSRLVPFHPRYRSMSDSHAARSGPASPGAASTSASRSNTPASHTPSRTPRPRASSPSSPTPHAWATRRTSPRPRSSSSPAASSLKPARFSTSSPPAAASPALVAASSTF